MTPDFGRALAAGVERVTAWADLLDRINVFPIADGDTGRNLVISLAPLHRAQAEGPLLSHRLLLAARGNSGNIASRFFQPFVQAGSPEALAQAVREGRDRARQAVPDPRPGTMLTFFDALAEVFPDKDSRSWGGSLVEILDSLASVTRSTTEMQPKLREAGVVDAGALGMFLYMEGFLASLAGRLETLRPVTETFPDRLRVAPTYQDGSEGGYCVDTLLQAPGDTAEAARQIALLGESVVVTREAGYLKVHLHTPDRVEARRCLAGFGKVLGWAEDDLAAQMAAFSAAGQRQAIHVITDAAGSLTRAEAQALGVTLLDSYLTIGERSLPETYFTAEELYGAMTAGVPVSTSQASVFERHQTYESVLCRYPQVLYLCVGSVYTGNYGVAMDWKRDHDPEDRLTVIDTGAASGRLGILALAVARFSLETEDPEAVKVFARQAAALCEEFIFLERLEYLAAGGRLSKTGAFLGDMLKMKPIVSPTAGGARKVGIARSREEQVRFALAQLARALPGGRRALVMLEYSDNRPWVEGVLQGEIARLHPAARLVVHPLSLTSGAHMGPGTWAVAFLPEG